MKITVVGDIMCEPLMLRASRNRQGYDFEEVFSGVRNLFQCSDFVIGNLETPVAGEDNGYVNELFSFNAPLEFASALKKAGISLVSTANNHCLDRGFQGLLETVHNLDSIELPHTGTYDFNEPGSRTFYTEIDGQTIAVIAYTYGVNYSIHHRKLDSEQESYINLLRPYTESVFLKKQGNISLASRIFNKSLSVFKHENRAAIKKALGLKYNSPRQDNALNNETAAPYLEKLRNDIREAKEKADVVFFLPHTGGQFNLEPGAFTKAVFDMAIESGADAIIASHPHIVQKAEMKEGVPCFYSIGNFSMSPNSVYLLHENLPDYGLAVHFYVDEKTISKITFSILKIIEKKDTILKVFPIDEYADTISDTAEYEILRKDVSQIYETVTGNSFHNVIEREYVFYNF